MQEARNQLRLINSYRQPPNLKKISTRAKFAYTQSIHNTAAKITKHETTIKCNDKNVAHVL